MQQLRAILCCAIFSVVRGQIPEISWLIGAYEYFEQELAESDCKRDLKCAYDGFMANEMWVFEMIDAWAKPQTGILTGHIMHIGNFDECLAVRGQHNGTQIRGKYCSVLVAPTNQNLFQFFLDPTQNVKLNNNETVTSIARNPDTLKTSWGICVPVSCTSRDLRDIWRLTREYFGIGIDVYVEDTYCDYEEKNSLSIGALCTIIFLAGMVVLIVLCTIYDIVFYQRRQRKEPNVIVAFSAYTNSRKILSTRTNNEYLQCLNGIRVISMIWIVLAHRILIGYDLPHLNARPLYKAKQEVQNMIFYGATYAVDTFFLISGFLICYLFLQSQEKSIKFNVPLFLLHRLLRLTPSLAVLVLLSSTLILYAGNGPFWPYVYDVFQKTCEENWWITMLYVQNYVQPMSMCLPHTWYLAVDTQLYILSPLILIPLAKWPKKTICVLVGLILASMAWVFAHSYMLKLGPTVLGNSPASSKLGYSTHARASVWLIGFILAYVMHKLKHTTIKIHTAAVSFMWISTISGALAIIFGLSAFTDGKNSVIAASLYNALSRPCWSLAVCWFIFACTKNLGGIVNKILSLPIFNALIKINYNMYLLHIIPMTYFGGQGRMSTYTYRAYECYGFWSDVVATIILAFIWTLAFEAPVIVLEKIVFKTGVSKRSQKNGHLSSHIADVESGKTETVGTSNGNST